MNLKTLIFFIACCLLLLVNPALAADSDYFNSTWNTTKISTGSTPANQIKLPLEVGGNYNFTVWWGDGNSDVITAYDQANVTHAYASNQSYNISIYGTIDGWRFNNGGDKLKITDVSQWGTLKLGNSNGYFYGCSNLDVSATDTLDTSSVTTFQYAFRDCSGLTTLNVSSWDTSSVTSFSNAFYGCSGLTTLNVSSWDTSSVTSFYYAFYGCSGLTNLDVSSWDTSSVTSFYYAFYGCSGLTTLDVSSWDTSSVTSFSNAFYGCSGLTTLDVSSWDTSSVTSFYSTFRDCSGLTTLNVSSWDTSSVTSFSNAFSGCSGLTNLDVSSWNTSSVTAFDAAFYGCSGLTTLDVSSWDTSSVTTFNYAFRDCSGLTTLNVSSWDTSSVTSFSNAFRGCSGLTTLDVSSWDTSSVTSFYIAFYGCSGLTNLDVSSWDTSSVTSFSYAFYGCSGLTDITGIGSLNVSTCTDFTNMFYGATLSTTTYNNLLVGWASLSSLSLSEAFHGGSSKYSAGIPAAARNDTLIGVWGWTITDGGVSEDPYVPPGGDAPNITSTTPSSSTVASYENVAQTFLATANQTGNWTFYINGTSVQTNTSVSTASYTNSTALNASSIMNVTASITNANGTDSFQWNWTVLLNSVDTTVTYWNPDSGGLVATIAVSNITAGTQSINFLLNDTNAYYLYTVTHSNGTFVDSDTSTYENESLNFSIPLIEDSYNITETVQIPLISNLVNSSINSTAQLITAESNQTAVNWTVPVWITGQPPVYFYQNGTQNLSITITDLIAGQEYDYNVTAAHQYDSTANTTTADFTFATLSGSTITAFANQWTFYSNATENTTCENFCDAEDNITSLTMWNEITQRWETYYSGWNWNKDTVIPSYRAVMAYFESETTITTETVTPSYYPFTEGYNMGAVQGSSNTTLGDMNTSIGANCTAIYSWNGSDWITDSTTVLTPNIGWFAEVNSTWNLTGRTI